MVYSGIIIDHLQYISLGYTYYIVHLSISFQGSETRIDFLVDQDLLNLRANKLVSDL